MSTSQNSFRNAVGKIVAILSHPHELSFIEYEYFSASSRIQYIEIIVQ